MGLEFLAETVRNGRPPRDRLPELMRQARKGKYMRLYAGNAHQYLGKKIDRKKRIFGYYPMEVKQFPDGKYYVKDAVGVCMPLPDKEDDFNSVNFDFIVSD